FDMVANPNARVTDLNSDDTMGRISGRVNGVEHDFPAPSELDCVAQVVQYDLAHARSVAHDHVSRTFRHAILDLVQLEDQALVLECWLEHGDNLLDSLGWVERFAVQR